MFGNYMIDSWCDEIDQEYELKRMALEQKLYKERMQRYDQKCRVGKRYPVCDHLKDMILEEVSQHGKHPANALADNGFLTDKTPAIGHTSPQPDYKLFYEAYKNNIARIEIERTAKNALNSGQISLRCYSCIASMLSKNSPITEIEKLFISCVNGDI